MTRPKIENKYLNHEHGFGRDLHVVAKLKILEERDGLCHAHIPVSFEDHVGYGEAWHYVPHYVLRYDIKSRCLRA